VDDTYRTIASREGRAVQGFSMGGEGAAHLGFKYPEVFGTVSIMAPAMFTPDQAQPQPANGWKHMFSDLFGSDTALWQANDPFSLVHNNANELRDRTYIRIVAHEEDQHWLAPQCQKLHILMMELMIPHAFYYLPNVKWHSYGEVLDSLGDSAFDFFTTNMNRYPPRPAPPAGGSARPDRSLNWVDPDHTAPLGSKYEIFHSATINADVSYLVWLPPGYDQDTAKRYPVLYSLHASNGTPARDAPALLSRLEPAIRAGRVAPMIVVFANGLRAVTGWCNSFDGKYPVESVVMKDLIPHIDATYRTIASREGRAVQGFSAGGGGAAHLGLKFPDVFGTVSIMAPALPYAAWRNTYGRSPRIASSPAEKAFHMADDPVNLAYENADKIRDRTYIRIVAHDEEQHWLAPACDELHNTLMELRIPNAYFYLVNVKWHSYGQVLDSLGDSAFDLFTSHMNGFPPKPAQGRLGPVGPRAAGGRTLLSERLH
jgi:enterochelin esterase-like enzyme